MSSITGGMSDRCVVSDLCVTISDQCVLSDQCVMMSD